MFTGNWPFVFLFCFVFNFPKSVLDTLSFVSVFNITFSILFFCFSLVVVFCFIVVVFFLPFNIIKCHRQPHYLIMYQGIRTKLFLFQGRPKINKNIEAYHNHPVKFSLCNVIKSCFVIT